jgi:type I restriction enzyme S subunit
LSDVDGLLGGLDRLIAKKRNLKQAAMQQLLTGQTRLPGFSGVWEVKRLGDVALVSKGAQLKSDLSDEAGAGQGLARRVIDQSQAAVVEVDLSLTEGRNSQRRGDNEVSELIHGIFC